MVNVTQLCIQLVNKVVVFILLELSKTIQLFAEHILEGHVLDFDCSSHWRGGSICISYWLRYVVDSMAKLHLCLSIWRSYHCSILEGQLLKTTIILDLWRNSSLRVIFICNTDQWSSLNLTNYSQHLFYKMCLGCLRFIIAFTFFLKGG